MAVEFFRHNIEEEDKKELLKVLDSVFLTTGPVVSQFEKAFSERTGNPYVVALNSCTGALHLALEALGIGPGDEVITTPMTFVATALAIEHTGAKPVFVDVEERTGLIDPNLIEAAITPRTRAILPVHLYGTMCDMRALKEICDRKGLFLVEDAAHCVEGERDGVRPGQLSDAVCYSFYATKNLACGEGGALGCRSQALEEKVRRLRLHGMNKDASSRYHGGYQHWDVEEAGWKYNMDSIHASLLIKQLDRLTRMWERRRELALNYQKLPLDMPQVVGRSAYHLQTVWVEERDCWLRALKELGIGVAVNYRAVHTLGLYKKCYKPEDFPRAYAIGEKTLSLPLYPKLGDEEQAEVLLAIHNLLEDRSGLLLLS